MIFVRFVLGMPGKDEPKDLNWKPI